MKLSEVHQIMATGLEHDRKQKSVNVSGDTLEDALQQASVELGIPIKKIDYEVLDPGSRGIMGLNKRPTLILAYGSTSAVSEETVDSDFDFDSDYSNPEAQVDGKIWVKRGPDGAYMKVSPPVGNGVKASERQAVEMLTQRVPEGYDESLVSKTVKKAADSFVKIASFDHNPSNDATVTYELANMEMQAYLIVRQPGPGGADPSPDYIRSFLDMNGIAEGLLDDAIERLANSPPYGERVLVAQGIQPEDGQDGQVLYSFDIQDHSVKLKEIDGKVDFKELNIIHNVVEGQILAKIKPPTRGEPGQTVTGKYLPAKNGKPAELEVGKNVVISGDKQTASAGCNGQVNLVGKRLSVDPIYAVAGDVSLKTGNILFLGSVVVKGNVQDGFSVKAAGNIEIQGNVGKADIEAEGDVIVRQGISGRNEGSIKAGGNVWSRFIENAKIESGDMVICSDGIINSTVTADKRILCRGKRAAIVGGTCFAAEEISAKTLGSVAGGETFITVGFDPKRKQQLDELLQKEDTLSKEIEDLALNIMTLEKLVKAKKKLSPEKLANYKEIKGQERQKQEELRQLRPEIEELQNYLSSLKSQGQISASSHVYPGVKLNVRDAKLEVRNEFKAVTFINEDNQVKIKKYEAREEDLPLRPSEGV